MTGARTGRTELSLGSARVLFTSRADGNLSTLAGVDAAQGAARRKRLAEELGLTRLCAGPQVHGATVDVIGSAEPAGAAPLERPADARLTRLARVAVMVLAADCVPVALVGDSAVGAVHAGWRGLAAGVLEQAALSHTQIDGEPPRRAVIGPCAGPCCYEVGVEVFGAFGMSAGAAGHIDLRAIAVERLAASGVADVEVIDRCTVCDDRYFSYRREGELSGRQGVLVWHD